jgi:methylated-DNA-[protein]-cysteine S-methyltransferase
MFSSATASRRGSLRQAKSDSGAISYTYLETSIGILLLTSSHSGLQSILFSKNGRPAAPDSEWREDASPLQETICQLRSYFAGELDSFDLALAPQGTVFQQRVWGELCRIPYGETISYGELAKRIGNPNASRAVGLANGSNPIPIVIPCHRVIGSNGKLTGYGGGLPIKEKLLALERCQLRLL